MRTPHGAFSCVLSQSGLGVDCWTGNFWRKVIFVNMVELGSIQSREW